MREILELESAKPLPPQAEARGRAVTFLWDQAGRARGWPAVGPPPQEAELRPTFQSVSTAKRKVSEFS